MSFRDASDTMKDFLLLNFRQPEGGQWDGDEGAFPPRDIDEVAYHKMLRTKEMEKPSDATGVLSSILAQQAFSKLKPEERRRAAIRLELPPAAAAAAQVEMKTKSDDSEMKDETKTKGDDSNMRDEPKSKTRPDFECSTCMTAIDSTHVLRTFKCDHCTPWAPHCSDKCYQKHIEAGRHIRVQPPV